MTVEEHGCDSEGARARKCGEDTLVCRCEEVSEADVRRVIREGARTLSEVKRATRAGMGLCQGRTCQRIIARMISEEANLPPASIAPPSARPPLRPISVGVMAGEPAGAAPGESNGHGDGDSGAA